MPIVLVELPATDAADVNAPALIAACSSGLRRGTCATAEAPDGERATAVAIVEWLDADHLRARIDVGRRAERRGGWQVRELTFHQQDALVERWRSVGLAIAGVVGEATLLEPAKPEPAKPEPAKPEPAGTPAPTSINPPAPASAHSAPAPAFRVALGPAVETGLRASNPALGGWFDFGWRAIPALPVELTLSAAHAWSVRESSGVASRFSTFGVGASGSLDAGRSVELRGSLFGALEAVAASASDPDTGAHASGARWLGGVMGRAQAIWPASSPVSGVLGLEITRLSGATQLKVHGQGIAISPAWRGTAQAGLEWKF